MCGYTRQSRGVAAHNKRAPALHQIAATTGCDEVRELVPSTISTRHDVIDVRRRCAAVDAGPRVTIHHDTSQSAPRCSRALATERAHCRASHSRVPRDAPPSSSGWAASVCARTARRTRASADFAAVRLRQPQLQTASTVAVLRSITILVTCSSLSVVASFVASCRSASRSQVTAVALVPQAERLSDVDLAGHALILRSACQVNVCATVQARCRPVSRIALPANGGCLPVRSAFHRLRDRRWAVSPQCVEWDLRQRAVPGAVGPGHTRSVQLSHRPSLDRESFSGEQLASCVLSQSSDASWPAIRDATHRASDTQVIVSERIGVVAFEAG